MVKFNGWGMDRVWTMFSDWNSVLWSINDVDTWTCLNKKFCKCVKNDLSDVNKGQIRRICNMSLMITTRSMARLHLQRRTVGDWVQQNCCKSDSKHQYLPWRLFPKKTDQRELHKINIHERVSAAKSLITDAKKWVMIIKLAVGAQRWSYALSTLDSFWEKFGNI